MMQRAVEEMKNKKKTIKSNKSNYLSIAIKPVGIEHMTPAAMQYTSPISLHDNLIKL